MAVDVAFGFGAIVAQHIVGFVGNRVCPEQGGIFVEENVIRKGFLFGFCTQGKIDVP